MMNPVRRQFVLATDALAPFLKATSRNPPCHVGGNVNHTMLSQMLGDSGGEPEGDSGSREITQQRYR
jgi:hypothetical protein